MAYGICYTQSGTVKRYEGIKRGDVPDKVTVYTVGYPSTAYYSDGGGISFSIIPYPPSPGFPEVEGFVDGTAIYFTDVYLRDIGNMGTVNDTYTKIYNLMSYTPPYGYVLDKNGDYTYIAEATVYSYNYGIKYYDKTNIVDGGTKIKKEFRYKKKDINSKVYVKLSVSNDIIINGNIYHPYERPTINTINLESGDGSVMNILVGLDSNHDTAAFDISFEGVSPSNIKTYLLVNNNYYDVTTTSNESKRCYISKYENHFHIVGYMYTTGGFDYTFNSNDWENNSLFTQEGTKDSSGRNIPSNVKAKFVVKFVLSNGYYHQDCQLTVDVTTNK